MLAALLVFALVLGTAAVGTLALAVGYRLLCRALAPRCPACGRKRGELDVAVNGVEFWSCAACGESWRVYAREGA